MSENRPQYPNNLYDYNEANERRSQDRKCLDNEMNYEHFHCNAANEWNNENNIHYNQQNYARKDRANHEFKPFQVRKRKVAISFSFQIAITNI